MSSSTIFDPGFGASRQRGRWWRDDDGAYATSVSDEAEDIAVIWSLIDWLATSETVSSAAYVDAGVVTSSKSVSSPTVLFTATGVGETEVTVTTSNGRNRVAVFRIYRDGGAPRDYTT